jgi:hypothetical protein
MLSLIVVLLCTLGGAALTYFAIYKINPESFKVSASIMRFASFAMEIRLSQSRVHAETKPRRSNRNQLKGDK